MVELRAPGYLADYRLRWLPRSRFDNVVCARAEATGADRRRAERFRPGPLRVELHLGFAGTLLDLSEFGARLDLPEPEAVSALITFDLHCEGTVLTLHGRVVRSTPTYDGPSVGRWMEPSSYHVAIDFFDVGTHSTTTLREHLRHGAR